ncbi:MAG: hypothetical protein RLZZ511_3150 [Cyanobacteriota bacterium]
MRNHTNRLICLDAAVPDLAMLREGVVPAARIVELRAAEDGFAQIAAALAAAQQPIHELHIVTHGTVGCLHIAGAVIDGAALSQYAAVLAEWQTGLADDAGIYLYGCEIAAGPVGRAFVQQFSQLVGRSVAASETLTGNSAQGGDWELAWRVGQIPVAIAFDAATQAAYPAVLSNLNLTGINLGATNLLVNNGSALQAGNVLRLTDDLTFQRASSYTIVPMQLDGSTSFNSSFQFRLGGAAGTNGTDGFTFVLQNSAAGIKALGFDGGNMGYGGIDRSIAIKFDTFKNEGIDLSDNTISILRDGSVVNALATTQAPVDLNDGQLHTAWIDYDGLTDILNVYVGDGTKPAQALLSTTIDLTTVLGNQAYMGFTAGSGFIGARQEISNWSFQAPNVRASAPLPPTPTANVNLATLSPALISLNGAANRAATAIELTPDRQHSRGSAFYNAPVQIGPNTGFNTQFQFVLDGAAGTTGADGFTFALQNSSAGSQALGAVGSYVGIGLVEKSLAVKFDTYKNANDVAENTVAIVLNGEVYAPIALQALPFDLNNGAAYSAWVDYDGLTDQLTVYVSDGTAKPAVAVLTTTIDLTTVVGEQAYVGFTAAAGGIAQRQTVTGWQFQTGNGVAQPPVGTGGGLRGEYFDNANFTNLRVVRVDPTVNYNWAGGSPEPAIGPDTFSVRWSGQVQAQYDEAYTFYTTTDDGVRLTVNGQVLINQLAVQGGPAENLGTITLAAGQRYDIVLEYLEDDLDAQAQLAWSSASQVRQVIPQSQLYTVPYNPGTIFMGSENFSVQENSQFATVRFDRIGGSDGYATVNYNTANASALSGQDYTSIQTNVTFAPGETEKTVQIPILNDALIEGNEVFNVALGETAGADLGTRRTVGITILDDDAVNSVFNLSRANYTVNENAGTASITIQRSGDTTVPATVNYTTTNGTATAGADYTTTTGTMNFAANEVTKVLLIPITNDVAAETNETLTITLSAPTGGTLGATTLSTLTIADNDVNGTFTKEILTTNLVEPTAFEFAPVPPAGQPQLTFIAEKRGTVRVMSNGVQLPGNFIDISNDVNNTRDRGLIGIAVHPQFYAGAPYIYLSYTYDPPEAALGNGDAGRDGNGNRPSRMIRVEADAATGFTTFKAGTQVVLLGTNSTWANTSRPDLNSTDRINFGVPSSGRNPDGSWIQDYLATDSESHSIGDVTFGPDGFLYVSNGDGTSYSDADPRADRVMDINNLSGKLLRLDPLTGKGVASNPFWDGNGDSNQSKVWNLGLRNPFRFTFNDDTGLPVIGDVGWGSWEEVNVGTRGSNFGWPYYEGNSDGSLRSSYATNADTGTDVLAAAFYARNVDVTAPAFSYLHDGPNAIVVGDFYNGPAADFQGGLFTSDASRGTIDVLFFNAAQDKVDITKTRRFETNLFGVTQMQAGPDGSMYFVTLGFGGQPSTFQRWVYA